MVATSPRRRTIYVGLRPTVTMPNEYERAVNRARSRAGVPPLQTALLVRDSTRLKANDMFARDYWGHVDPDGHRVSDVMKSVGFAAKFWGENLLHSGPAKYNGDEAVDRWLSSKGHRENLLNPRYTHQAVYQLTGRYQGYESTHLYVQHLATPKRGRLRRW